MRGGSLTRAQERVREQKAPIYRISPMTCKQGLAGVEGTLIRGAAWWS